MSKEREQRLLAQQTSDRVRDQYRHEKVKAAQELGAQFAAALYECYDEDLAGFNRHKENVGALVVHLTQRERNLGRQIERNEREQRLRADLM